MLVNFEKSRMVIRNEVRSVVLVRRGDLGNMLRDLAGNVGDGYVV